MKKLFNLLLLCTFCLAIFSSCSKDDEASLDEKETTYTFFYSAIDIPDGFDLDITLFEYNENNERVSQKNINSVHQGYSEKYVADKNAKKVKVYMKNFHTKHNKKPPAYSIIFETKKRNFTN